MVVVNKKGITKEIPLTSWPLNGKNRKLEVDCKESASTTEEKKNKLK
jgi:hypothetical protein